MRVKLFVLSFFVASGILIASINIYNSTQPPKDPVQRTTILAGSDLPVEPEVLAKQSNKDKANLPVNTGPLKATVITEKGFLQPKIKTTQKGDNLLVLVNKTIRLSSTYVPSGLVTLDNSIKAGWSGMLLRKEAAGALLKLFNDAKKKGFNLNVNSAYRSYQTQLNTYNYWVSQVGVVEADRFSARPGHSQHQLGTTIDITSDTVGKKLLASFGTTPEGKWLVTDGYKYGFVLSYPAGFEQVTGYTYEPWHFRYIGVENAKKWKNSNLILEQYLQKFGV